MKTDGNDLVNPMWVNNGEGDRGYTHDGLTKRELFAAMAMQGLMSVPTMTFDDIIRNSVDYADALIEELNKQNNGKKD